MQSLFLQHSYDTFGVYDHKKRTLRIDEMHTPANSSLVNLAAVKTFLNGGNVYQIEQEMMPVPVEEMNALYRYENPEPASKN